MDLCNDLIRETLFKVAKEYPQDLINSQLKDIARMTFHISLVSGGNNLNELRLCDLGGGIGLFSVACAALGARVLLVDDFDDAINRQFGDSIFDLHRKYGVRVMSRDVVREGMDDIQEQFDVVTSFESMEHWHHSPKKLFHGVTQTLVHKGKFVLGTPNCVNLRKRVTVPFGRGKWSSMNDWYEAEVFRGHVREPDVTDLKYIARDMKLDNIRIFGRNWLGYTSGSLATRAVTRVIDYPLRLFPALCSDIYLVGENRH